MYCPKCGTQNVDNASFCRGCGANVSLIPQALNGHLPEAIAAGDDGRAGQHREEDEPNLSKAIVKIFVGIAFVLVALSVKNVSQIAGQLWWFWMLIPAAGSFGTGVAEFIRLNQQRKPHALSNHAYVPPAIPDAMRAGSELPPRKTPDTYTPASVTEQTTKLLDKDR